MAARGGKRPDACAAARLQYYVEANARGFSITFLSRFLEGHYWSSGPEGDISATRDSRGAGRERLPFAEDRHRSTKCAQIFCNVICAYRPETQGPCRSNELAMLFFVIRKHCYVRAGNGSSEPPLALDGESAGLDISARVNDEQIDVLSALFSRVVCHESGAEAIDSDFVRHSQPFFLKYSFSSFVR